MKIQIEKIRAVRICVEVTEDYANSFLTIFNNVREQPELLKVENDRENNIYVTVDAEHRAPGEIWLGKFGEIKEVIPLTAFRPVVDTYDDSEEDELFEGEYLPLTLF